MLGWPWGVIIKWLLQSRGCYYSASTVFSKLLKLL